MFDSYVIALHLAGISGGHAWRQDVSGCPLNQLKSRENGSCQLQFMSLTETSSTTIETPV